MLKEGLRSDDSASQIIVVLNVLEELQAQVLTGW